MTIDSIKIKRVARGEVVAAWAQSLQDSSWLAGAKVLKDEPRSSWVRRANIMDRDVVVKCRLLNRVGRRFKSALGVGHGDKQWRGAELLESKKIKTSRPLMHGVARIDGARVELLVLEYLAGPTLLEVMDAVARGVGPPVRAQHRIAVEVGRTIPQLIDARLWNRDHKPSNLIVLDLESADFSIAIIDCVGLRRCLPGRPDTGEAEEMCASLMTEPTGCNCRPRAALWMRVLRSMCSVEDCVRFDRHEILRPMIWEIGSNMPSREQAKPKVNPLASADR